jgi:hypothetical protein
MAHKYSPVVRSNVRFSGSRESLQVHVWFCDRTELQRLIDALIELRDSVGDQPDHVHLQHYDLAGRNQVGLAEVNFFRPGRGITDVENDLIDMAIADLAPKKETLKKGAGVFCGGCRGPSS